MITITNDVFEQLSESVFEQLSELSTPYMKAINEDVEEAFPDIHPDVTYTAGLGLQLGVLLQALNEETRPQAVALINSILKDTGYWMAGPKVPS